MKRKRVFFILSILLLSIVACQGARIICKRSADLADSPNGGIITIAWDSNTEPYLGGYEVHYGTSSSFGKSIRKYKNCVDVGKVTESLPGVTKYTLVGLVKGKQYYIAVNAYSIYEPRTWSGLSNEVSGVAK